MKVFTADETIRIVREIVQRDPMRRNPSRRNFDDDGTPSCIVGHFLHEARDDDGARLDDRIFRNAESALDDEPFEAVAAMLADLSIVAFEQAARHVLIELQAVADEGDYDEEENFHAWRTWGDAMAAAVA